MNDTVKLTLTPAPKGERYDFGNGFSLPVAAHAVNNEENINIPVFNTMTDYKWQLRVFESRLKHPDSYATFEDVELMRKTVGDSVKIKAAGGIRDLETALRMIELGVSRIGSTASVAIVEELIQKNKA